MNKKEKVQSIVISWDFVLAMVGTILLILFESNPIEANIMEKLSSTNLSILSIIFSLFFAVLTILITSGDNEFVKFLNDHNVYLKLIWLFRWTLLIIFIALISSLALYISTVFIIENNLNRNFPWFLMGPYYFFSFYALFCTISSAFDAIKYAEYRAKYIAALYNNNGNEEKLN